jgi:hypothetical protein
MRRIILPILRYPVDLGTETPDADSYKFGYWDNNNAEFYPLLAVSPDLPSADPEVDYRNAGAGYGMLNYMKMPSGSTYNYQYDFLPGEGVETYMDAGSIAKGVYVWKKKHHARWGNSAAMDFSENIR